MKLFLPLLCLLFPFPVLAKVPFPIPMINPKPIGKEAPLLNAPLYTRDGRQTNLVLTLLKTGQRPTSFDWSLLGITTTTTKYRVEKVRDAGCGSKKLYARETKSRHPALLVVLDHSSRFCDDVVPAVWEVSLTRQKQTDSYLGHPKPIGEKPDCSRVNQGVACIMIYSPTSCEMNQWDSKPLSPPLVSASGNHCLAMQELKVAACERGLDYNKLDEEEVNCTVQPICPLPMCAAPPEGCHYRSSDAKDELGCPVYPCGQLVCQ